MNDDGEGNANAGVDAQAVRRDGLAAVAVILVTVALIVLVVSSLV